MTDSAWRRTKRCLYIRTESKQRRQRTMWNTLSHMYVANRTAHMRMPPPAVCGKARVGGRAHDDGDTHAMLGHNTGAGARREDAYRPHRRCPPGLRDKLMGTTLVHNASITR